MLTTLGAVFLGLAFTVGVVLIGTRQKFLAGVALVSAVLGVILLVVGAAGGNESPSGSTLAPTSSPRVPARTEVRFYEPFGEQGLNPPLQVTRVVGGYCWTGSVVDHTRPDAWRCMASSIIYDPCFEDPIAFSTMVCAESPWATDLIELQLTRRLPLGERNDGGGSQNLPWGVELTNGERCLLLSGATAATGTMRWNYGCPSGNWVVGEVGRRGRQWRVFYFQPDVSPALVEVAVRVAWY